MDNDDDALEAFDGFLAAGGRELAEPGVEPGSALGEGPPAEGGFCAKPPGPGRPRLSDERLGCTIWIAKEPS